ncbi:M3 family oligoendopeptidase [Helicobacter sp. MIT 21-1697]|uniref:M3 family oligoendopeptidase n=1 Tax=Helicobacter sp. MIT 21-1697 TaxID=2993733 RepID=UPI00224B0F08|nr:M3 family oligoendopeptidase [Helicobacter sp. MIT 21-1697]MCX2716603.1 M3 family oligoendopeptidase [Helicobacter sp. MIT 21-1697]
MRGVLESSQWDLNALFRTREQLERFMSSHTRRAKKFAKNYEGQLQCVKPNEFESLIQEYEQILEGLGRIMTYVFLHFAKDTTQGDLYAKYEMQTTQIQNLVLFFEIEFCKIPASQREEIVQHTPRYAYFLEKLIEQDAYQLSLAEEKVLLATSPVGVGAFSRLFDEHLAQLRFVPVKKENKKSSKGKKSQKLSEEEILSLLHHSKRSVRKDAQKVFSKKLKRSRHLLSYIFNMVRKDLSITTILRGYKLPESFRHIHNGATQKSVDKLIDIVSAHYGIVGEYYRIKASLLGISELQDYDRYAPLDTHTSEISYDEAIKLVLKAFGDFSKEFKDIALKALKKGWVDSHPTPNKRGGAFSHGSVPSAHPYVLLNYTNSRRDAFTIAHEFGHMIHQELSKTQGYLNMDTPLTTAETASVFAEMLLFDMLKTTLNKQELISLYAGKLEDIFSTLFRQIVMTHFERRIHAQTEELKPEVFDKIWREENERMFGDSLKLTKNYDSWWCYIPHFVHSPFYCYAYSYGQLLVLALFGLYKSQKTPRMRAKFIQKYTDFLSLGGSKSPKDLIASFGFNLESDKFWLIGMAEVQKMLDEFKELVNAQNSLSPTF